MDIKSFNSSISQSFNSVNRKTESKRCLKVANNLDMQDRSDSIEDEVYSTMNKNVTIQMNLEKIIKNGFANFSMSSISPDMASELLENGKFSSIDTSKRVFQKIDEISNDDQELLRSARTAIVKLKHNISYSNRLPEVVEETFERTEELIKNRFADLEYSIFDELF